MATSSKRSSSTTRMTAGAGDPRISNVGRWPVRVTDIVLTEPYQQPPVDYLEIYFVREGSFLHESDAGKQTLREGSIIVGHPRNRQALKHPENCRLSRIRFLPEWLAADFSTLIDSPFTVSAILAQQWFELPDRESIYVFSARPERYHYLTGELDFLRDQLAEGAATDVLTRITLVKILLQVGEEYSHFLRQRGGIDLPLECHYLFAEIELRLLRGDAPTVVDEAMIAACGTSKKLDSFATFFKKHTGLSPDDYLLRRRLEHAAYYLLTSEQRAGTIATGLGFADAADLTRQFEARYRVSPAVYRQKFAPPAAADADENAA